MSEVLYKKKPITLNSSQNVCQYLDPEKETLISMIGEFHDESFKCKNNSMNIWDYCNERLESNPRCLVLMEYSSNYNLPPPNINSEPIRKLARNNKFSSRIQGWDTRWKYLNGSKGQTTLYYEEIEDKGELKSQFISPLKRIFLKNNKKYSNRHKRILRNYEEKLQKEIQKIKIESDNLQTKLRDIWMYVSDYEILKKILGQSSYNEIIIVAGKYHLDNLCPFLSSYFQKIHSSNIKSTKKCATIYTPTTISEILNSN